MQEVYIVTTLDKDQNVTQQQWEAEYNAAPGDMQILDSGVPGRHVIDTQQNRCWVPGGSY